MGKIVLIVETEFLIALSMQVALQGIGVSQFVVMTKHDEALSDQESWSRADMAIIEVEQRRDEHLALVRAIAGQGIPVLGITADSQLKKGVPELSDTPVLVKPVLDEDLVEAVEALMGSPAA